VAEPVMGAGGVIVPPKTYFEKIAKVCEAHDVYMISDEVICGFGRLGRNFGCEALGFRPHGLSVAKALSSAYLPIAGVMIPEVMYQALLEESRKLGGFHHGFTYSGHPVAAAVAVKTLDIYARDKVFAAAAARIPQFQQHLKKLGEHPLVGEARGLGLMGGLELVADKKTRRAFDAKQNVAARCVRFAEDEGLIVRAVVGNTVTACPPLIIKADEVDELFARLSRALDRTLDWAKREKLLAS
jgi:4-aminobutyrate---pyruvate transaminase